MKKEAINPGKRKPGDVITKVNTEIDLTINHYDHKCLYCCLCFKDLTPEECHIREDGEKEDVCEECAELERKMIEKYGHE